jgi:hypothetical protein
MSLDVTARCAALTAPLEQLASVECDDVLARAGHPVRPGRRRRLLADLRRRRDCVRCVHRGRAAVRRHRRRQCAHAAIAARADFEHAAIMRDAGQPVRRSETFFETLCGLASDGKVSTKTQLPSFLQTVLLFHEFREECGAPGFAGTATRGLFAVLAPLARARGYRSHYPQYSDADGSLAARSSLAARCSAVCGMLP